jgi:hypothetical protein
MIFESHVWKSELARDLRTVRRYIQKAKSLYRKRNSDDAEAAFERAAVAIEKFAFTSAFIIRKLSESMKLSDELEATPLPIQAFARIRPNDSIDFLNRHKIEKYYNMKSPRRMSIAPAKLCNALIHSFVFEVALDSILFNSDWTKNRELLQVELEDFFSFIQSVISDDIVAMKVVRGRVAPQVLKSRQTLKQ